jgi:Protein of unknown function (DUF3237)
MATGFDWGGLKSAPLCVAEFEVGGGLVAIGKTAFGERRLGYVTGGHFEGERLKGEILPGGGNWSTAGRLGADKSVGTFDARSVWRTHDGALIYLTYTGRSIIPDDVGAAFRDPAREANVSPADYQLRVAMVFETADPRYEWINGVLAIGCGERLSAGVRHTIYEIK